MTMQTTALPPTPPEIDIHAYKPQKSAYYKATIAEKMFHAQRVIEALTEDPEVISIMEPYGYDIVKIASFRAVFDTARNAHIRQQKEYGEKGGAYEAFEKEFSVTKNNINYLCKVMKVAFREDRAIKDTFKMKYLNNKRIGEFFDYTDGLYEMILNDDKILAVLDKYNYPQQKIQMMFEQFKKTRALHRLFVKENDESIDATQTRNEFLNELDNWMYDYYALAKVAYALKPDFHVANPDGNQM